MAQYLPAEDSFDASVGPAGGFSCLYFRALPWDADGISPPTGTGLEMTPGPVDSHIYSGWWGVGGATNAVMTGTRTGGQRHGCFIFRSTIVENVEVSALVRTIFSDSTSTQTRSRYGAQAIGCRIRGGNHDGTDPQQDEETESIDGYWFIRGVNTDSSASGFRWLLVRVNAGTLTVLAQDPTHPTLYTIDGMGQGAPTGLRMTAETVGSTVELRCYWTPYYLPTGLGRLRPGTEYLVLSYDDSSASRIDETGRIGLMSGLDYTTGGFDSAPTFDYLQAIDLTNSALLFRDEFTRRNQFEALSVNKVGSFTGRSLAQQFYRDLWGATGYRLGTPVYPDEATATAIRITATDVTNGSSVYFLSQREADDNKAQDRSISFFLESTGTIGTVARRVEVALRESGSAPTATIAFYRGYIARALRDDTSGSATVTLFRRQTGTAAFEQLATASASIALDTWKTLRFSVEDVTGPNFGHPDTPQLKVYLDATQVVLVAPSSPILGVFFDANGTVWDETAARIGSGNGEGFGVLMPTSGTRAIRLDAWAQGGTATPGTTPEDEQVSIAVGAESDGATGTLTIPADWPVREVVERYVRVHRFESGHSYRNARALDGRQVWEIEAAAQDVDDLDALRAFYDSHKGVEIPFTWTTPPPRSETVTARFMDDSLEDALRAPTVGRYRFRLERCVG